jgi:SAM-dependent methyltransferase
MSGISHDDLIRDQFTRQAVPFSTAAPISDEHALAMVVEAAKPRLSDEVLDMACGGGLIVCAFAPHVRHATGIDLTPAMLERARAFAAEKQLDNVAWRQGDVRSLPWPDASFDIVVTRFSFHHFPDPLAALREMVRVCRPGGRIVVVDMYASADKEKAEAWNRLEVMRDPSHVRALTLEELTGLFGDAGMSPPDVRRYELRGEVQGLLARSFPLPGDAERVTALFEAQIERDTMGIEVWRREGALHYAYRVAILSAMLD